MKARKPSAEVTAHGGAAEDLRPRASGATAAGTARPSSPSSIFAEDFSLLIRTPRRLRIARSRIRVLS